MSYASLMVYVEGESERIRLAVDLAARFQASLVGVAARAPVPVVTGGRGDRCRPAGTRKR